MLVQLKAAGAVVALLAGTAVVTAVGGAVAVAADSVDPGPRIRLSNSPSRSISLLPAQVLPSRKAPTFADRAAVRAALHAPGGYGAASGSGQAALVTQVEGVIDKDDVLKVSGCSLFGKQGVVLLTCAGTTQLDVAPQVAEQDLRGQVLGRYAGSGVLLGPTVQGNLTQTVASGSRGPTVVYLVAFAQSTLPDATATGLVGELLDGLGA